MESKVGPDGMMDIGCRVHGWMIDPFTNVLREHGYRPILRRDETHFVIVFKYTPGHDHAARQAIGEATLHCSEHEPMYQQRYRQAKTAKKIRSKSSLRKRR